MKKAPYILWLASWYPTRLDVFPGDFIQRHAKALALYYPVHVLHIAKDVNGDITKDVLIEENINGNLHETIIYYHPTKTGFSLLDRIFSTRKFLKVGKNFIKDVCVQQASIFIHVHVAMRHGLLARWAKESLSIKYIITEHWTGYYRSAYPAHLRPSKWYWMATKNIFRHAYYFYPEVKRMGELINKTITAIPYKPVSNSVDTTLFYADNKKDNEFEIFNFIHVSTLSYQKNIDGILRVIERCSMQNIPVHFTLVGPASNDVITKIKRSPALLKITTLTGALPYDLVAGQMRKANALLMFSRYENQPCVILEALCCGLPVISTNVGGIAEVIDNSNGILIESENEDELCKALNAMIKTYSIFDRNKIALEAANAYSYETTGRQILEYYQQDMAEFFV